MLFSGKAYRYNYYYHGDHLGSSNYVTDKKGRVFEHTLYLPYGETWVDEGSDTSLLGYKFTGKELDEETGLYYFGARYFEPKYSNWVSTDQALPDYLPLGSQIYFPEKSFNSTSLKGAGGIYNSININSYQYGKMNPLKYIDPDGNEDIIIVENSQAQNSTYNQTALVYDSGTLTSDKLGILQSIRKSNGGHLNEKDVMNVLGNTDRKFDNLRTTPDNSKNSGTVQEGLSYSYEKASMGNFPGAKTLLLNYGGTDQLPQDPKTHNGINPATDKSYVDEVFIHPAWSATASGSRGCSTMYNAGDNVPGGNYTEFNKFSDSLKDKTGSVIIFR